MTDQLATKLKSVVHNFYVVVLISGALALVFIPPMQVFALDTPKTDVIVPDNQQDPSSDDNNATNPEQPPKDENDNPNADLVAIINAFINEHTTTDPLVVKGSLDHLPEGSSARVLLLNSDGVEMAKSDITVTGSDVELAKLTLPTDINNGSYIVRLEIFKKDAESESETVLQKVEEKITINIASVVPEDTVITPEPVEQNPPVKAPTQPSSGQDNYEELKIDIAPLKTISSVKNPVTGAVNKLGFATTSSSTDAASAVITGKSSNNNEDTASPAKSDSNIDSDKPIQSINLKSTESKNGVAIQPSKNGWQIFGLPWYWCGTGLVIVYGSWVGVRRFLQREV